MGGTNYWNAIAKRLADKWIAGQALPGTWAKARIDEAFQAWLETDTARLQAVMRLRLA